MLGDEPMPEPFQKGLYRKVTFDSQGDRDARQQQPDVS